MGAYGFGLDFRVRACVHNHISDIYGPISFILCGKTTHDGIHMHIILFHGAIKDGRLAAILDVKIHGVEHFLNHFLKMHLSNRFKLGRKRKNDGLHKHAIYFRDQIQDGQLVAILLLQCIANHFSDMYRPILFKCGTSTVHDGIHLYQTSFCDLIKDDRLVRWWPF